MTIWRKIYIIVLLFISVHIGCCDFCDCFEDKLTQPQNNIFAHYMFNYANNTINIFFIKGDIARTLMLNPQHNISKQLTQNTSQDKWYFKNTAIVNAANPELNGGTGVDASIHLCFKNLNAHTKKAKDIDQQNNEGKYEKNNKKAKLRQSETLVEDVNNIIPSVDYFHFSHIFHTIGIHDTSLDAKKKQSYTKKHTKIYFH